MKEIRSGTSKLINHNKKVEDFKKNMPKFLEYQLKRSSFSGSTTKVTSSTHQFRVCSRKGKCGVPGSIFSLEEKSAPFASTTVGTERSKPGFSFRGEDSMFLKKNSLPIVDRHIKTNRVMMRSSIWSQGT